MTDPKVEEFIAHYGVKGMRWGVRKQRTTSSDYKKTAHLRNRRPSELTNKQLKSVNERVNLEANYRRLHPHTVDRGEKRAKELLKVLGTAAAFYTMAQSPAGKALTARGKQAISKVGEAVMKRTIPIRA